jgi:hypothetical protein
VLILARTLTGNGDDEHWHTRVLCCVKLTTLILLIFYLFRDYKANCKLKLIHHTGDSGGFRTAAPTVFSRGGGGNPTASGGGPAVGGGTAAGCARKGARRWHRKGNPNGPSWTAGAVWAYWAAQGGPSRSGRFQGYQRMSRGAVR